MYFDNCKTLDDLKAAYKKLAMKHHPDMGGDVRTMQNINAEYECRFERLKVCYNAAQADQDKPQTNETPEEFMSIIDQLMKLSGIEIELCGSWLWIGGNTYDHKAELKAAGCLWSRSKHKWYWRHQSDGAKWSRGRYSMSKIREKYGSQVFATSTRDALTA